MLTGSRLKAGSNVLQDVTNLFASRKLPLDRFATGGQRSFLNTHSRELIPWLTASAVSFFPTNSGRRVAGLWFGSQQRRLDSTHPRPQAPAVSAFSRESHAIRRPRPHHVSNQLWHGAYAPQIQGSCAFHLLFSVFSPLLMVCAFGAMQTTEQLLLELCTHAELIQIHANRVQYLLYLHFMEYLSAVIWPELELALLRKYGPFSIQDGLTQKPIVEVARENGHAPCVPPTSLRCRWLIPQSPPVLLSTLTR